MPKYRVYAEELLHYEADVEAENVEEAWAKVQEQDPGGFTLVESTWHDPDGWQVERLDLPATPEERQAAYLASGGYICPFCWSASGIEGYEGPWQEDSATTANEVHCTDCGAAWTEYYDLARIKERSVGRQGGLVPPTPAEAGQATEE